MSQKRDKGHQQHSSPTSSSGEESTRRAATYLSPLAGRDAPSQYQEGIPWGDNPLTSRQYASTVAPQAASGPSRNPSLPSARSNVPSTFERQRGAAPLADILIQESAVATPSGPPGTRQDPVQISPISPPQPDLSPLRLHGEPGSPERSRSQYFDPARSSFEAYQESESSSSRPFSGYPTLAGSSRSGQDFPAGTSSSPPFQPSVAATTLSSAEYELPPEPRNLNTNMCVVGTGLR